MNRPDLDAIEAADRRIGNIRNGDLEEVIAYARHLEDRISELETALVGLIVAQSKKPAAREEETKRAAEILNRKGE